MTRGMRGFKITSISFRQSAYQGSAVEPFSSGLRIVRIGPFTMAVNIQASLPFSMVESFRTNLRKLRRRVEEVETTCVEIIREFDDLDRQIGQVTIPPEDLKVDNDELGDPSKVHFSFEPFPLFNQCQSLKEMTFDTIPGDAIAAFTASTSASVRESMDPVCVDSEFELQYPDDPTPEIPVLNSEVRNDEKYTQVITETEPSKNKQRQHLQLATPKISTSTRPIHAKSSSLSMNKEAEIKADILDIVRSKRHPPAETSQRVEPRSNAGDQSKEREGLSSSVTTEVKHNSDDRNKFIRRSTSVSSLSDKLQRTSQSLFSRLCESISKLPSVFPGRPGDDNWEPVAHKEWIQPGGDLLKYLEKAAPAYTWPENSIFFFPTRTYNAANVAPHYIVFGAKGQFLPSIQGAGTSSTAGPNAMMTRGEFEFIYGEARELFVVDGAFIKYAGLYRLKSMAHIAPNGVGLFEPWDRLAIDALVSQTLPETPKNPRMIKITSESLKFPSKREIKLMYTEGQLKVDVGALQMLSFNRTLYDVLRGAYRANLPQLGPSLMQKDGGLKPKTKVKEKGKEKEEGIADKHKSVGSSSKKRRKSEHAYTSGLSEAISKAHAAEPDKELAGVLEHPTKRRKHGAEGTVIQDLPSLSTKVAGESTAQTAQKKHVRVGSMSSVSKMTSEGSKPTKSKPKLKGSESQMPAAKKQTTKALDTSSSKRYKSAEFVLTSDSDSEPEKNTIMAKPNFRELMRDSLDLDGEVSRKRLEDDMQRAIDKDSDMGDLEMTNKSGWITLK
ncbi:hypothetical protein VKT23_013469 [Stygiomarasmius scandens]|uniref:Uncharacterized protein n=1 Tax=Marasmiellus scandens TaxID=2682957 RepID=A0ABR1J8C4_9AGAR